MNHLERLMPSLLLSVLLALPATALAQTYSWVDEDGNTHYGDSIPPEYRDQEQRTLRDGLEVERLDRAPTEEEREARRQAQALAEEARRAEELQAERDNRLLRLYGSVEEIERIRNDRVAGLRSQIRLPSANLEDLEDDLAAVEDRLDGFDERGEEPPERLLQRYEDLSNQVTDHQRHLLEREEQLEAVRDRFNDDIERFSEIQDR